MVKWLSGLFFADIDLLPCFSLCLVHSGHRHLLQQVDWPWWWCLVGSSYRLPSHWPWSVPVDRAHRRSLSRQMSVHSGDTERPRLRLHWWCGLSRSWQSQSCTSCSMEKGKQQEIVCSNCSCLLKIKKNLSLEFNSITKAWSVLQRIKSCSSRLPSKGQCLKLHF